MIVRFCAYGFLKNLRLFEAFLVLALLERGLDFLAIGGLIAVREVAVNLLEVPSGAVADGVGRRRCLVLSMAAYLIAYIVLGLAESWAILALGMVVYGVGDAFRSGTHKALIYAWLRQQGRTAERTRIYGHTRSWSKLGSAVSALAGTAVLLTSDDYRWIFLASAGPAVLNLLNLVTYPAALDETIPGARGGWRRSWTHLRVAAGACLRRGRLRRLVVASMGMEGGYAAAKDYLQPLLQTLAIATPIGLGLSGDERSAVILGAVAALAFLLASAAARQAHRCEAALGGADRAADRLILVQAGLFLAIGAALLLDVPWIAVAAFVILGIAENLWRPIHVGRFDRDGAEDHAATTLSIEAQAKALATAALAPLLGALIDACGGGAGAPPITLAPVALLALPLALIALSQRRARDA